MYKLYTPLESRPLSARDSMQATFLDPSGGLSFRLFPEQR